MNHKYATVEYSKQFSLRFQTEPDHGQPQWAQCFFFVKSRIIGEIHRVLDHYTNLNQPLATHCSKWRCNLL